MSAEIVAAVIAELPGWRPAQNGSMAGVLCRELGGGWAIGGIAPDGRPYWKFTALAPEGPDTPNDPVVAARWLHRHAMGLAPVNEILVPCETDGLELGAEILANEPDAGHDSLAGDQHNDGGVDVADQTGSEDSDPELVIDFVEGSPDDGLEPSEHEPSEPRQLEGSTYLDADFAALEPPPPEPESAPAAESVAIFGDNLDMLRVYKIGAVTTRAAELIDAIRARADEAESEFADLQAYVVTNLDRATGAFVGTEQGKFDRFVILSDVRAAIDAVERLRDQRIDTIRQGERAFVEAFNVSEGWPS